MPAACRYRLVSDGPLPGPHCINPSPCWISQREKPSVKFANTARYLPAPPRRKKLSSVWSVSAAARYKFVSNEDGAYGPTTGVAFQYIPPPCVNIHRVPVSDHSDARNAGSFRLLVLNAQIGPA